MLEKSSKRCHSKGFSLDALFGSAYKGVSEASMNLTLIGISILGIGFTIWQLVLIREAIDENTDAVDTNSVLLDGVLSHFSGLIEVVHPPDCEAGECAYCEAEKMTPTGMRGGEEGH
jgi:hypothetical protein